MQRHHRSKLQVANRIVSAFRCDCLSRTEFARGVLGHLKSLDFELPDKLIRAEWRLYHSHNIATGREELLVREV